MVGPEEPEVVYAEIVDDDDDEATGVISGEASGLSEVTDLRAQRDEYLDSLRRLQADFENYKKRVAKQQSDQVARAALSLVEKLLPVLDTLDLATSHIGDAGSADGRALVAASSQLRDVLAKEGLERIDPIGEEFDPNAHEAVGHVPAEADRLFLPRPVPDRSVRPVSLAPLPVRRVSRWWPRSCARGTAGVAPWCARPWSRCGDSGTRDSRIETERGSQVETRWRRNANGLRRITTRR